MKQLLENTENCIASDGGQIGIRFSTHMYKYVNLFFIYTFDQNFLAFKPYCPENSSENRR